MNRNILYNFKKQINNAPMTLYEHEEVDYKSQIEQLRSNLRRKETDIIRYKATIDQLKLTISKMTAQKKIIAQETSEKQQNQVQQFDQISFILENKQLNETNRILKQQSNILNGQKNELEAENRQLKAELDRLKRRVKEIQIISKMRQERFEDQVKGIKPVIVTIEEDKELKQASLMVINYVRQGIVEKIFEIFIMSANQSQQRKLSSLIVFKNNINQLRKNQRNCMLICCRMHQEYKKVIRMFEKDFAKVDNQIIRDTFNSWLQASLADVIDKSKVKSKNKNEQQILYLFRLNALYYRTRYPLKGDTYRVDNDLQVKLQSKMVKALLELLVESP